MSMIDKVPAFSNAQLAKIFFNALQIRSNSPVGAARRSEAIQLLRAIGDEWAARIARAEQPLSAAGEIPETGMLATLGYHVGHGGERTATRRAILDYLMTEQLPMVDSPVYVAEWGEPLSKKRLDKFCRTVDALIRQKKHMKGMEMAISQWEEDRSWMISTYAHQVV